VTHNSALETTGLYLYTTEIESVKQYWFGLNGLYNGAYQHAIASIVWGGKVDFATWFSSDPNDIYGIQLLPFTPGSAYLGQLPDIAPYFADLQAHGGKSNGSWGDLLIMWQSYYHPSQALAQKDTVPAANMNSLRSLFLYTLYAHASQGVQG
jgi:endoglucanase Acf2